jgi:hypothetical protein
MQHQRPWWDGAQWRLDPNPPEVAPAPLGDDGWPLVVIPPALKTARQLAVLHSAVLLFAALLAASIYNVTFVVGVLAGLEVVVGLALFLNALSLTSLRARVRRRVFTLELVLVLVGVASIAAQRRLVGWVPMVLGLVVLGLLARRDVRTAVAAGSAEVPYADVPRLPRPVDALRVWKQTGREV